MRKALTSMIIVFLLMISLAQLEASGQNVKIGSFPIVWLQCQFADDTSMPYPLEHYQWLIGSEYPGAENFWHTVSYGVVNFNGSVIKGPFSIGPWSSYKLESADTAEKTASKKHLVEDCAREAGREVYFPSFFGIGLFFSRELDGFNYGSSQLLNINGTLEKMYAVMLLGTSAGPSVVAHEVGHGVFSFRHSLSVDGVPDSEWDVMSKGMFLPPVEEARFGFLWPVPVHPIAVWKRKAGWISDAGVYTPEAGSIQTVRVDHLATTNVDVGTYRVIEIPVSSTVSYVVEVRRPNDQYDHGIPDPATLVYSVEYNREPILAAVMENGETFTTENMVYVTVVSSDTTGSFILVDARKMIVPLIEVISPRAGEQWEIGTVHLISWQWPGSFSAWIDVSRDGGRTWRVLVGDIANSGTYYWRVSRPRSDRTLVRIRSGQHEAASGLFAIVKKQKRAR